MNTLNPVAERILDWYDRNHRDLPWRLTRNPYFIWVSEVMLQQTQVETVIPYYHRFLSRFPTVKALAQAPLQEVLKVWENMGYYTRPRHLHAAAREIMTKMDGEIPNNPHDLLHLPGIGPYTAGAILSFAFGLRLPAVDGNVRRVLCRLYAIQDPMDGSIAQSRINALAGDLVPAEDPSRFNQGLMDLGATVCTPRRPSCSACPVQDLCLASQKGLQEQLPVTRKRGPIPLRQMTAGIINDTQWRLLIVQRPIKGLLGGLWKFPGGEKVAGESLEDSLCKAIDVELGVGVKVGEKVVSVKHAYTHFRIILHAFRCTLNGDEPKVLNCSAFQWVEPSKLAHFPFSKADRKIMAAL